MKYTSMQKFLSLVFLLSPWFLFTGTLVMAENTTVVKVSVGVVLDLETRVGKMGLSCIQMALSDLYNSHAHYKTRIVLQIRDSKQDVVGSAAAALDLIKNVKVQAIIGPQSSMQADFITHIGDKAQVPVISFSATSTSRSSIHSSYFIRATQNDTSQVKAISALVQEFGWREAVPIYTENDYGEAFIPCLTDALQEIGTRVPYRSIIPPSATDDQIDEELYKLMSMQTRVFIVHMLPPLGTRFFLKAKELGMMSDGYVWIITDGLGNLLNFLNPRVIDSMQGVLGLKTYIQNTNKLEKFTVRWTRKFRQDNPTTINTKLNIYGLRAYDAALALAMAVEKVGALNFGFLQKNISANSTDLETFGVSQIGPELQQAISTTKFKGLSGDFHIVDGQIEPPAFQIFNLIGNGGREIGFWTRDNGISRELNFVNREAYNTYKDNLRVVIWPGELTSVPKGWVSPTNGKKLRIGVPVISFPEFVKVTRDQSTNTPDITGYSIEVFEAVMEALPYPVAYEFHPFENPDGKTAGTYDELILQVSDQKYDAVAGDITIRENRSKYVDFTLPYTESGVSMIAPVKDNRRKNAWVFLKPLTWDLWVTSGCFFVFIGFVIWILEHQDNEDFRGSPSHQVGTIFWFSFSTMVFAHKEKVMSNLARFVVIIWVFVVLILTQSYTASLSSMLTAEKLQPTINDVNELIRKGEHVGYLEGSFVFELLKSMGFDETKLKQYSSQEECHEFFSKGSANGGIAAAFDEIPYTRLFLKKYYSKYTMVGPTYKAEGFGFIFPKNSPLVPDISRAVLKVVESSKMSDIENRWLGKQMSCPEPSNTAFTNSLGLESFWGLFLIAAVASFSALIIFMATFLYEKRHVFIQFEEARVSPWSKIKVMMKHFDQKDLRESGMGANKISPNTNYPPPSPSSLSNQTDGDSAYFGEGRLSTEYGSNRQTHLDIVSAIELIEPEEERPRIPGIVHTNH